MPSTTLVPPLYNEVFNMWGLDTGVDWAISSDYGK